MLRILRQNSILHLKIDVLISFFTLVTHFLDPASGGRNQCQSIQLLLLTQMHLVWTAGVRVADVHHQTTAFAAPTGHKALWSVLLFCVSTATTELSLSCTVSVIHAVTVWFYFAPHNLTDASFFFFSLSITARWMHPDFKTCCCSRCTALTINTKTLPLALATVNSVYRSLSGFKLFRRTDSTFSKTGSVAS